MNSSGFCIDANKFSIQLFYFIFCFNNFCIFLSIEYTKLGALHPALHNVSVPHIGVLL